MTRNDTSEETADVCMQLQQQHQQQQQEMVAESQYLNKNDRKANKNKLRKKHPVYSSLRKAAKKSCTAAKEPIKNSAIKVQDKRDNIVEQHHQQQQNMNWSKASSPMETTPKLTDIPDSWELLYDLNLLPDKWTVDGMVEQEQEQETLAAASSVEHVRSECQQTEESSWIYEGDSKESTDSSEQGDEEFDKKMAKQKIADISSTPSENISMHFLMHPQQLKESTEELQSEALESATSIQLTNRLDLNMEPEAECMNGNLASETSVNGSLDQQKTSIADESTIEVAEEVPNASIIDGQQNVTFSEGSTQWEGIDDLASNSNDVETVNWSCEIHSNNEDNELAQQECDDPYKNWMERPRRGTLRAVRYKTEMCRTYEEGLPCTYGVRCQFAHGFHELRFQPRHPKHKTELCHMFHSLGICRYGRRCSFVHTEHPSLLSQMRLNQQQQQQLQQYQQQQQYRMYINENRYTDFQGFAISIDKIQNTMQAASCRSQSSALKQMDSDSANFDVNNLSNNENAVAAVFHDQNYSNVCNDDVTVDPGNESASNQLACNALTDQAQSPQQLVEEPQLQQNVDNLLSPMSQESISEGVTASTSTADNSQRHSNQKMVCVMNGALPPPVPWTNAVLYVPYEACRFHNTEGPMVHPSQLSMRNYNNNNNNNNNSNNHHYHNYAFCGHQQQEQQQQHQLPPQAHAVQHHHMPPPQQAVAAFQASNGIVYFYNALQAPPTPPTPAAVVNNLPLYAAPFQCQAAAEQRNIFQQTPPNMQGNFYAATAAAAQPTVGNHHNHANKYIPILPHLGAAAAVPYVGNVYYVAASAAVQNPTPAYGNYAYTTNA